MKDVYAEFMDALVNCDTVTVSLKGIGEATFETKDVYEAIKPRACFYCRGIEEHKIVSCNHFKDITGITTRNIDTPYNYCPNCGRKM